MRLLPLVVDMLIPSWAAGNLFAGSWSPGPGNAGVTWPTDLLGVSINRSGYLPAVAVAVAMTFRSDDRGKVVLRPPATQIPERIDMASLRGHEGIPTTIRSR